MFIWLKYCHALFGICWLVFCYFHSFVQLSQSVQVKTVFLCSMDTAQVSKVVVIHIPTFFQAWQSLYDPYFLSFCQPLSSLYLEHALTHKLDP